MKATLICALIVVCSLGRALGSGVDSSAVDLSLKTPVVIKQEPPPASVDWWDRLTKLASAVGATGAAMAAILAIFIPARNYIQVRSDELEQRKKDLEWRRFEFMTAEWQRFLEDPDLIEAVRMVEAGARDLQRVLETDAGDLSDHDHVLRAKADKYFEYLERLTYGVTLNTLSEEDVDFFGWHFAQIAETPWLANYVRTNGYVYVADYAREFVRRKPRTVAR